MLLVIALFMLGVMSPGPNFLVVVARSMASGFRPGFATGLGVAAGDALYAAAGLLGLAALVEQAGWVAGWVRTLGALYLVWMGLRMVRQSRSASTRPPPGAERASLVDCFRVGLFTDLANPKTVVFFASIFATSYDPQHPSWVAGCMWAGILMSSLAWRSALAAAFSRGGMRAFYGRCRPGLEALFGSLLVFGGLRLAATTRAN